MEHGDEIHKEPWCKVLCHQCKCQALKDCDQVGHWCAREKHVGPGQNLEEPLHYCFECRRIDPRWPWWYGAVWSATPWLHCNCPRPYLYAKWSELEHHQWIVKDESRTGCNQKTVVLQESEEMLVDVALENFTDNWKKADWWIIEDFYQIPWTPVKETPPSSWKETQFDRQRLYNFARTYGSFGRLSFGVL